jgi:putative component of toxin-antitoxin plasmid stabilization module
MPRTEVRAFRKSKTDIPIKGWLSDLAEREPQVYRKCLRRITRLGELGYELHQQNRNEAAHLRDGIFELRIRHGRVNYRILYFFHENKFVCLSHGIKKERVVPPSEIDSAIENRSLVSSDPEKYTTTTF